MAKIVDYWAVYIGDGQPQVFISGSPPPQEYIDYKTTEEPVFSEGIYRFTTIEGRKVMITARNIESFSWEPIFKDLA